jgi:hypothetical protein
MEYFGRSAGILVRISPTLLALLAVASVATRYLLLFSSLRKGLLSRSQV